MNIHPLLPSWFSFVSTAFRAAARELLVWSSLCWTSSVSEDDSEDRGLPTGLLAAREGLRGPGGTGAVGPGAAEEANATLWTTLTVNVGEDRPPKEHDMRTSFTPTAVKVWVKEDQQVLTQSGPDQQVFYNTASYKLTVTSPSIEQEDSTKSHNFLYKTIYI